jgi:hypothetical protein
VVIICPFYHKQLLPEQFEDTKGVIRSRKFTLEKMYQAMKWSSYVRNILERLPILGIPL